MNAMREQLIQLGGGAHALAIQILGNAEDASDAVQESFAAVLGRPGAYDASRGPLRPWFLRLVRNRCIDMLHARRPGREIAAEAADSAPGPGAAAEIDESREQSLDRMINEAEGLGANAIVAVRFSTSVMMAGAAERLAVGTAVVI